MVHGRKVYTERAETAAVSCDTSHASAVSTPLRWILKTNKITNKQKKKKKNDQRRDNFLLRGQLSVLILISVTAVARKRFRSFCQKYGWQVTA